MITQERLKELFDYNPDTGIFTRKTGVRGRNGKIGSIAGHLRKDGYITLSVDRNPYYAHQLAFLYMEGYLPEMVDHINRVRNDNRWSNLRESNYQENQRNKTTRSKSGYLGISWNRQNQKWQVHVRDSDKKSVYGGYFEYKDLNLAIQCANELRLQLHGKNAILETFDSTKPLPILEELNK